MTDAAEKPSSIDITAAALAEFAPFNILSDHYLDEAHAALEVHQVAKGKLIFKRGRELDKCFYLFSGHVDLIDNAFEVTQVQAMSERASVALNHESPTTVSAIAKSPCRFFTIDKEYLDRLVGWSQSTSKPRAASDASISEIGVEEMADEGSDDWMTNLLQAPLFTRVPMAQLQELFSSFETYSVKAGEQIVREGERGDYFYVVGSGTARITNRLGSVDVEIGPGQYFGEESLIGNTVRNATVTMASNGVLKRLTADNFNRLLMAPVLRYVDLDTLKDLNKPYKLVDVRIPVEFRIQHCPGAINVPLSRLRQSLQEFSHSNTYAVPADAGCRADIAVHLLCQAGFDAYILKAAKTSAES